MFKKGEKSYSVIKGKCPRCHEGGFFEFPFSFHPKKITKLHKNCPHCNLKYMMEPSFFYGAMYVNYGITVGLSIITFLLAKFVFSLSLLQSFAAIFSILILLAPVNLRLSRILWINMFVTFESNRKSK
ncbi:MAG: DUF983 domain-containing protein [Flavobacteriaceae bacterium]|nr:DUF983 domain-containing protein [Flavobacteriaceae bacterium]